MSDQSQNRMADWAPGTLDKTRQNIGSISDAEAAAMAKKLGGEVMYERSSPNTIAGQPKGTGVIRRTTSGGGSSGGSGSSGSSPTALGTNSESITNMATLARKRNREQLKEIPKSVNSSIDRLMMSPEYKIKQNYGFFNFIRAFSKSSAEKILPGFVIYSLKGDIEHLEGFITVIKKMIQIAPATYKAKILNEQEAKFKFLRMVASWTTGGLKAEYQSLVQLGTTVVTADLIPFIRGIFKPIISIYYYGENKIQKLIKEIYADMIAYPDAPQDVLSNIAKQAITEWLYIDTEIIKKLYPLLMRMCSDTFELYPDFYNVKIAEILKFEELHKFDLLLQDKPKEEKKKEPEKPKAPQKGAKDQTVITGLKLLTTLFPDAGFDRLDEHPDLYPYFQPLYKFDEGFNMLSAENPIQTIVVLLRIIEDCFQGCRNIEFIVPDAPKDAKTKEEPDNIIKVQEDWSAYREDVFYRLYCQPLVDMVNTIYSQPDYAKSHIGKRMVNSLLWQTTYHFLPNFKFDQLILEHPTDDSKYRPLFHRTDFARKYLADVIGQCDAVAASKGNVQAIKNPWEHYKFDIPNQVSKRLDVLLGAQNTSANTNANNANLLKYTLSFVAVLDWYLNNPGSPAYGSDPMHIYRVSTADGKPAFSAPERNDQNKLFAEAIKAAYQKKAK